MHVERNFSDAAQLLAIANECWSMPAKLLGLLDGHGPWSMPAKLLLLGLGCWSMPAKLLGHDDASRFHDSPRLGAGATQARSTPLCRRRSRVSARTPS